MEFFIFDDDYVRRLRERDRETSEDFVNYFRKHFQIILQHRIHKTANLEDITQEVFLVVLAKLDKGEYPEDAHKFGAWVTTIAKNKVFEANRKAGRSPDPLDDREFTDPGVAPDEEVTRKETAERIETVLAALKPQDTHLLRALHLEDRDGAELCRELGVGEGYLRVLHLRARERFRAEYKRRFHNL